MEIAKRLGTNILAVLGDMPTGIELSILNGEVTVTGIREGSRIEFDVTDADPKTVGDDILKIAQVMLMP